MTQMMSYQLGSCINEIGPRVRTERRLWLVPVDEQKYNFCHFQTKSKQRLNAAVGKPDLRTWNTLAIFPIARILLRITSLRAAMAPPSNNIHPQDSITGHLLLYTPPQ